VFITDSEGYLVGDTDTRTVEVTREWYLGFGWYANRLVGLLSPLSSVILYDHYRRLEAVGSRRQLVVDGAAVRRRFPRAVVVPRRRM